MLSKNLVQQFLDELSWRELWGPNPSEAFECIQKHIVEMTKWETGETLITRLNRISLNPFAEWSYTRGKQGIELLPEGIRGGMGLSEISELQKNAPHLLGIGGQLNTMNPPSTNPKSYLPVLNGPSSNKRKLSDEKVSCVQHFQREPKVMTLQTYYYGCSDGSSTTISKWGKNDFQRIKVFICF